MGMSEWTGYLRRMYAEDVQFPPLPVRKHACRDCAVTCGLYTEISDALRDEPEEVRRVLSERWFCHNTTGQACRGNWDNVMTGSASE